MAGLKRNYDVSDPHEELFVDDLAVAAAYAVAAPPVPLSKEVHATDDQDVIDLEDSLSAENTETLVIDTPENIAKDTSDTDGQDNGEDDDDDESDVDLEEQLRQMIDEEEEAPVSAATDSRPRTANEIDPYSSGQNELEFLFDVSEEERLRLKHLTRNHLKIAGNVRHLLASERTVVIQSKPGEAVLEEGTILVVCTTSLDENSYDSKIVPLGRVLEVFGPVSQPLYSVRLPEPLPVETTEATNAKDAHTVKENDPWAESGDFTNLLRRDTNAFPIYYVPEGVRVIDPALIMKASGRGSDASNFYDEEVTNPNDLDYSDDEQERVAKRKGRQNRQGIDSGGLFGSTRNHYGAAAVDNVLAPQGFLHVSQRETQFHSAHNMLPRYPGVASNNSGAHAPSSEQEESDTVYF